MKNFFLNFTTIISLFCLSIQIAYGKNYESICASTTFLIKSAHLKEYAYAIYYTSDKKQEKFLYGSVLENLYAACVTGFDGKEYLLLQETCGGSGCLDFGEYRIIDPISKKILLAEEPFSAEDELDVPQDDSKVARLSKLHNRAQRNIKAARKLLGYTPPLLPLINKFCCNNEDR